MWNADWWCSSLAIGDIGFSFNTANLCCNGYLLSVSVATAFKSLTATSVLAGTKNSRLEGFLLAKHKHTNIPTMMEPFPPPAPWFWWMNISHHREPLCKGLDETAVEGFYQNQYNKGEYNLLLLPCVDYNNCLPAIGNDSQNSIHCRRRATIIYKLTKDIVMNNSCSALFLIDLNMVV